MKIKIYLDCSVFGGYYDEEFETLTKPLFDRIMNGEFTVYISSILLEELSLAPQKVQDLLSDIPNQYLYSVSLTNEADQLAHKYIEAEALAAKHIADARHIAISSVNAVTVLVSWNFKHIVNFDRIRQYNIINQTHDYPIIDIRSPQSFFN